MERDARPEPDHLTLYEDLAAHPDAYDLFQALRVIEARFIEAPRFGESRRPREDRVRLAQEAELAFPPTSIAAYRALDGDAPGQLLNRAFGPFGPHGPLPLHLTEYARGRVRNHRDRSLFDFVNMFTHRLLSLFYRAWSSAEPCPSFDRPGRDPFGDVVAALAGYHGVGFAGRDAMPDRLKLFFAGHLASAPRHAEGLVAILHGFLGAEVRIEQFRGSWLTLEPSDLTVLGECGRLGQSAIAGCRVWSRGARFLVRVGPLSLHTYSRLLPGRATLAQVKAIVRNYVGDALDWDLVLVLRGTEVPAARLGRDGALGHSAWIGRRDKCRNADDFCVLG